MWTKLENAPIPVPKYSSIKTLFFEDVSFPNKYKCPLSARRLFRMFSCVAFLHAVIYHKEQRKKFNMDGLHHYQVNFILPHLPPSPPDGGKNR